MVWFCDPPEETGIPSRVTDTTRDPLAGVTVKVTLDPKATVTVLSFVPGGVTVPFGLAPPVALGVQETEIV